MARIAQGWGRSPLEVGVFTEAREWLSLQRSTERTPGANGDVGGAQPLPRTQARYRDRLAGQSRRGRGTRSHAQTLVGPPGCRLSVPTSRGAWEERHEQLGEGAHGSGRAGVRTRGGEPRHGPNREDRGRGVLSGLLEFGVTRNRFGGHLQRTRRPRGRVRNAALGAA